MGVMMSKCCDCKFADLYIPYWIYPWSNPRCKITGLSVKPSDDACSEFEQIGRLGR